MNEIHFLKTDTHLGTDQMELSIEVMLNSNGVIYKSDRRFSPGAIQLVGD